MNSAGKHARIKSNLSLRHLVLPRCQKLMGNKKGGIAALLKQKKSLMGDAMIMPLGPTLFLHKCVFPHAVYVVTPELPR